MFTTLLNFCSNDLSSFYFDIRKDTIYCDSKNSKKRRSSRTLLNILFNYIVRWLAPSLAFTCEEAWKARGNESSIHLEDFLKCKNNYKNELIFEKWKVIKDIRKVITGALEKKREEKIIGSSLEAHVDIFLDKKYELLIDRVDMAEIAIVSSFSYKFGEDSSTGFSLEEIQNVKIEVTKAHGNKCERCWKYNSDSKVESICKRCLEAIGK